MTTLRTITGQFQHVTGEVLPNTTITFVPVAMLAGDGDDVAILGDAFEVTSDGSGLVNFDAYEGDYTVEYTTSRGKVTRAARVPNDAPWTMGRVLTPAGTFNSSLVQQAAASAAAAEDAADRAEAAMGAIGLTPEAYGAEHGVVLLDPEARAVVDDVLAAGACTVAYARLLNETVRDFIRARQNIDAETGASDPLWDDVTYSVGAGGLVTFSASGLADREQIAFDWINDKYLSQRVGANTVGTQATITTAMLNEAEAIDPVANTAALQAWANACGNNAAVGRMAGGVYPVTAAGVRWPSGITAIGVHGITEIRKANGQSQWGCVAWAGDLNDPRRDIHLFNIIFDANYWNSTTAAVSSPVSSSLRGTALSMAYTSNFNVVGCGARDSYKHLMDFTGSRHPRSGTNYTYSAYTEVARNGWVDQCWGWGHGDDGITTHNARGIYFGKVWGGLASQAYGTTNGNFIEFDDDTDDCGALHVTSYFCYGMEIKGHPDAKAARNVSVNYSELVHCNNGSITRHIGHGDTVGDAEADPPKAPEPLSPTLRDITIGDLVVRSPLEWLTGNTKAGARVYAAKNTRFRSISVYQGDAPDDYYGDDYSSSDGVVQVFWSADGGHLGHVYVEGFPDAAAAVRITGSALGTWTYDSITTKNGPKRALSHTDNDDGTGAIVVGGPVVADRETLDAGTIAVRGVPGKTITGPISATNFERRFAVNDSSGTAEAVSLATARHSAAVLPAMSPRFNVMEFAADGSAPLLDRPTKSGIGYGGGNVVQSIAVDHANGWLYTQHVTTDPAALSGGYSEASLITRYPLHTLMGDEGRAPESQSTATSNLGHQGLAVQYRDDGTVSLWTSHPYGSDGGSKAIRFTYGATITGIETFTVFTPDGQLTSTTPAISPDGQFLVVRRPREVNSVAGNDFRVFRLADIDAAGDYRNLAFAEFWAAEAPDTSALQSLAVEGGYIYVLEGSTGPTDDNVLSVYAFDGRLVSRVVTEIGKGDSATSDSGLHHEPEALAIARVQGRDALLMLVASGDSASRDNRIYGLGLGVFRAMDDETPAIGAPVAISTDPSLIYKGRLTTTSLDDVWESGVYRIADGTDAAAVDAPLTSSGGILEVLRTGSLQSDRAENGNAIQRYTVRTSDGVPRLFQRRATGGTGSATWASEWTEFLSTAMLANPKNLPGVPVCIISAPGSALTGVTTEQTLYSTTFPTDILGPNGWFEVDILSAQTNNANNKTMRGRLGATEFLTSAAGFTSSTATHRTIWVQNNGSTSAQVIFPKDAAMSPTETTATGTDTMAEDTATALTLAITGQLANAGDTLTLRRVRVIACYMP